MNCHLSAEVKQTFTVVFNSVSIWQGKSIIFQCQTPLNKTLGTSQAAIYCAGQLAGSMCPPALIVINEGYCADTAFFSEEPSGTTSCILLESRRRDKALERFKPLRTGPAVPGKPLIFPIETTSNHHENGGLGGWVAGWLHARWRPGFHSHLWSCVMRLSKGCSFPQGPFPGVPEIQRDGNIDIDP